MAQKSRVCGDMGTGGGQGQHPWDPGERRIGSWQVARLCHPSSLLPRISRFYDCHRSLVRLQPGKLRTRGGHQ